MQDVVRVMVAKFLSEAQTEQPSRFVKEVLDRVTPPADAEATRKVVAISRRPGGRRKK